MIINRKWYRGFKHLYQVNAFGGISVFSSRRPQLPQSVELEEACGAGAAGARVTGRYLRVLAKFRRDRMNVVELLQVFEFQNGGCPPSWILKCANFHLPHGLWSLSACSCKISSRSDKRLRSYCKFSISKMAAVRHLGFLKHAIFYIPYALWA